MFEIVSQGLYFFLTLLFRIFFCVRIELELNQNLCEF